ncbi:universal stress protein [Mucilaginibacter xinganensis]|uniref:Nucleotide-binding universal stress protein, UspA family n=1 Tax=Mucilaginibacter xinganensis TaxID=1234841 RepID=A0A223P0I8_9SPHI|nr:universal stress protein [Mucilaginibacter xinganensis]ASU35464.1 Nucleotide-binding universal stress protein, UspA family [Mucilaginibacter xinganensis]
MNTIIVTTDYSPIAENAVAYAAAMAKYYNARLLLFNAFKLSVPASNTLLPSSSITALEKENNDRLRAAAERVAAEYGIIAGHETAYAFVEDNIKALVEKHNAALVIMGMAPESREQDIFGNTTTAAIGKLDFPVLAVPAGAVFRGLDKVLLACDVLHDSPLQVLSGIKEKIGDLCPVVEVFYVHQDIGKTDTEIRREKTGDITYLYKDVQSDNIVKAIKNEVIASSADLLIMVPGKYGFWSSLVHRSKTRKMASGLTIPLLAVPHPVCVAAG